MSTAQVELGVPTEPASLVEAEQQLASEHAQPIYTAELDGNAIHLVQQRCEAAAARCEAPHSDLLPTVAASWMEYASSTSMKVPEGSTEQRRIVAEMAPPAFRFDKCVVKLTQDQDALEDKVCPLLMQPQRMSQSARPVSTDGTPVLLQISMYARRAVALTRKTRGLGSHTGTPNRALDTPTTDEMDGEVLLSQRIHLTTRHTLADLVDEMMCRNAEIPERERWRDAMQTDTPGLSGHWTGAHDAGHGTVYPRYTGRRLETDVAVLIENQLYARLDPESEDSYVRALLSTPDAGLPSCTMYGGSLTTRLDALPPTAFAQPYWLLHGGDSLDAYPQTTFLRRWMLASLARQYYAPRKLVVRGEQDIPCEVCGGMRDATVAVLGGDAVKSQNDQQVRLDGMAQIVTYCCDTCYRAALGSAEPSADEPRPWTVLPLIHA